jgi:hypothetical protein
MLTAWEDVQYRITCMLRLEELKREWAFGRNTTGRCIVYEEARRRGEPIWIRK